ncbi:hypothetical protein FXO37_33821 [Capsicum annuum]|nr:hypothetical protein FXO37_33821 [Capsicum annuum]
MREPTMENAPLSPPPQALLERLKDYGQEDAFALWDELSPEEKHLLVNDIENIDLPRIDRIIRCSFHSQGLPAAAIEPVPESCVSTVEERTMEDREKWWKMGMKAIAEGKLGVLLLSGGQFREDLCCHYGTLDFNQGNQKQAMIMFMHNDKLL